MSFRTVLSIMLVLLAVSLPCMGQDSRNVELIESFPLDFGAIAHVKLVDNYALTVSENAGLVVFDVSDPESISPYSECKNVVTSGFSCLSGFEIIGDRAYYWNSRNVKIINISDLTQIEVIDSLTFYTSRNGHQSVNEVCVKDSSLFMTWGGSIKAYNISDPENPVLLDSIETDYESILSLAANSEYLFVIGLYRYGYQTYVSLETYSYSDPTNLRHTSTHNNERRVNDIEVDEDYAFLTLSDTNELCVCSIGNRGGLTVIGVGEDIGEIESMYRVNDYIFLATYSDHGLVREHGLITVDVSDKENPVIINDILTEGSVTGIDATGDHAFFANRYNGLKVLDISNMRNPLTVESYDPDYICETDFADSILYGVGKGMDGSGSICQLNLNQMTRGKVFDTRDESKSIAIENQYAFVADGDSGITVFDISDPDNVGIAGTYETGGFATMIRTKENYVFLADGAGGFIVLNAINPADMEQVYIFPEIDNANYISMNNRYAFVSSPYEGVYIFQIANPDEPDYIGMIESEGWEIITFATPCFLHFSDGGSVRIFDIFNIQAIRQISEIEIENDWGHRLALESAIPFIFIAGDRLYVKDIRNPDRPVGTGYIDLSPIHLRLFNNTIYATDGDFIHILDISDALSVDEPEPSVPVASSLVAAYPNPFNSQTRLSYNLSSPGNVSVSVISLDGRLIETHNIGTTEAGEHSITLDASGWATGIYLAQVIAGDQITTAKLVCLK